MADDVPFGAIQTAMIKGNFNEPGFDADKHIGKQFKNGDYKMPDDLLATALNEAKIIKAANEKSGLPLLKDNMLWSSASSLDGNPKELSDVELAAMMLARSMGKAELKGLVFKDAVHTFDNKLDHSDYAYTGLGSDIGAIQALNADVLATTKQIIGDNAEWFKKNGLVLSPAEDTTTPQANTAFTAQITKNAGAKK